MKLCVDIDSLPTCPDMTEMFWNNVYNYITTPTQEQYFIIHINSKLFYFRQTDYVMTENELREVAMEVLKQVDLHVKQMW